MLKRLSVCDVLTWVKLFLGIAVVIFGIIYQDIFGLIGLWPIGDFALRVFHPKYQKSCDLPVKSYSKRS